MSKAVRNLMQKSMQPQGADTPGGPLPPAPPGGPQPRPDAPFLAQGSPGGADAGGDIGEGSPEAAYDQVRTGLQALARDYPEAQKVLDEVEALWDKWMGGEGGSAIVSGTDAETLPA